LDARTGEERYQRTSGPRRFFNGLAWSPDGRTFVSTDLAALGLYDATTGDLIHTIPAPQSDYSGNLAWSPDSETLAVVQSRIRLYDRTTLGQRLTIEADVSEATWSADSRVLASSDRGHGIGFIPAGADVIRLWDAATGKELRNLSADSGVTGRVIWSPVGYRMAIPARNLVVWGIQ
jgi:WD40 repeat protein